MTKNSTFSFLDDYEMLYMSHVFDAMEHLLRDDEIHPDLNNHRVLQHYFDVACHDIDLIKEYIFPD